MRRPVVALVLGVVVGLSAGCAGDEPVAQSSAPSPTSTSAVATPTQTAPTDLDACVTAADGELLFDQGASTSANVAIMGDGAVGVVISYEVSRTVCPWLPLAERLVDAGYRVLLYDTVSGTATNHVVDRAALLRAQGASEVVLVGGSLGGAASIAAAPQIQPPVSAVISLSGGGIDISDAAPALTAPLLQIVSADDSPFAAVASQNDATTGSTDHQLVVLPGLVHASGLFASPDAESVLSAIVDFIGAHTAA